MQREFELRKEELKIRASESENKRLELEIAQKRLLVDEEDRKRNHELKKAKHDSEANEKHQTSLMLMKMMEKFSK